MNLRFLDAGVAKVQGTGEGSGKVLRRMLRTKTAWRLAAITVIAIGALLLEHAAGHRHGDRARHLPDPLRHRRCADHLRPRRGAVSMHFAAGKITVGDHAVSHARSSACTINLDIVWSSVIAGVIVLALGFAVRAKVTKGVPGKLQLAYETIVEQIRELADSSIGTEGRRFVPLAIMLFLFILICNWFEILPEHRQGLAAHADRRRQPAPRHGPDGHRLGARRVRQGSGLARLPAATTPTPYKAMIPINIIEELTKPITLTFRLFGNIFSGGLMMVVVMATLLPWYASFVGQMIWKPFDLGIGLIQAFIFALLTILYFGMAMSHEEH